MFTEALQFGGRGRRSPRVRLLPRKSISAPWTPTMACEPRFVLGWGGRGWMDMAFALPLPRSRGHTPHMPDPQGVCAWETGDRLWGERPGASGRTSVSPGAEQGAAPTSSRLSGGWQLSQGHKQSCNRLPGRSGAHAEPLGRQTVWGPGPRRSSRSPCADQAPGAWPTLSRPTWAPGLSTPLWTAPPALRGQRHSPQGPRGPWAAPPSGRVQGGAVSSCRALAARSASRC